MADNTVFEAIQSKSLPLFATAVSRIRQHKDEGGLLVCDGSVDVEVGTGPAPAPPAPVENPAEAPAAVQDNGVPAPEQVSE